MGKGSLKDKKTRHEEILTCLRSQDFWTSSEICKKLSISYRTLMRDLAELKEAGIPIESDRGRGGGISLSGRWGISKLHLSNIEVISLLISLAISETIENPLIKKNLTTIRNRIASAFPAEQQKIIQKLRNRIFFGKKASEHIVSDYKTPNQTTLETLANSFFNYQKVKIEYLSGKNEITERTIEPHILLLNWPIWYFLCWDELRKDIRVFRIDRVTTASIINKKFKTRKKELLMKGMEDFFNNI